MGVKKNKGNCVCKETAREHRQTQHKIKKNKEKKKKEKIVLPAWKSPERQHMIKKNKEKIFFFACMEISREGRQMQRRQPVLGLLTHA